MNITDEMHEAASRAAEDAYRRWHATPNRDAYVSGFIAAAAKNAAEAVAPLIAAQALRSAAEDVRDNDDVHSHGDRCSYGPPGMCDCDRGATFRWLVSRAAGRCGAPDPHRGFDACVLDPSHVPTFAHRYGPVELPEQCCAAPNMVWEHSRAGKDHFRCVGCGGGMTKARATDA